MNGSATANQPPLLTVKEAAHRLALSERSLWSLTNRGEIRCVRIGRAVRYDHVDLSEFIERAKRRAVVDSSRFDAPLKG
jgi:excisionase family DNA binding protein